MPPTKCVSLLVIFNKQKVQKGVFCNLYLNCDGETVETVSDFIFGAPKSLQMVIAAMKLKDAYSLEGKL